MPARPRQVFATLPPCYEDAERGVAIDAAQCAEVRVIRSPRQRPRCRCQYRVVTGCCHKPGKLAVGRRPPGVIRHVIAYAKWPPTLPRCTPLEVATSRYAMSPVYHVKQPLSAVAAAAAAAIFVTGRQTRFSCEHGHVYAYRHATTPSVLPTVVSQPGMMASFVCHCSCCAVLPEVCVQQRVRGRGAVEARGASAYEMACARGSARGVAGSACRRRRRVPPV